MQIFNQLGGIELANAYKLIKAISKKMVDVIAKFKPEFIKGTMDKGVSKEKAEEIFELILKFGGYGFNKSHSTRYAFVAFQTAYMKVYHPVEYMAALLTFEMGSTEKVVEYIEDCKRLPLPDGTRGIKVLPPDINVSDKDFTPVYVEEEAPKGKRKAAPKKVGVIRFGLMAVRGVGEKAVEAVIAEREKGPFASIYDFCERVDLRTMTRSTIEALIKCGAFASISPTRAPLLAVLENAVEAGQQIQNDKRSGQLAMFGAAPTSTGPRMTNVALPDVEEFKPAELLKFEKELLGFYITSHPLNEHQAAMERYSTDTTREAMNRSEGTEVTIGGMISRVKKVITKNGRSAGMPMAIITLEDLEGQIDATAFAETYAEITQKYPNAVATESIVFVRGKIDRKRETPSILVNEIIPIEDAVNRLTTGVVLKLDPTKHAADTLQEIKPLLQKYKGNSEVYCQVPSPAGLVSIRLDRSVSVKPSKEMEEDLQMKLGNEAVQLLGAGTKRAKMRQQKLFNAEESVAVETVPTTDDIIAAMDAEMAEA